MKVFGALMLLCCTDWVRGQQALETVAPVRGSMPVETVGTVNCTAPAIFSSGLSLVISNCQSTSNPCAFGVSTLGNTSCPTGQQCCLNNLNSATSLADKSCTQFPSNLAQCQSRCTNGTTPIPAKCVKGTCCWVGGAETTVDAQTIPATTTITDPSPDPDAPLPRRRRSLFSRLICGKIRCYWVRWWLVCEFRFIFPCGLGR